jgi:long-chain acyl-CoA synthetase
VNTPIELPTQSKPEVVTRTPLSDSEPQTLVQVFRRLVVEHNRPDALNYKRDGSWLAVSSDEFLRRAQNIAAGLYSLGVRKTDRIAILSDSRLEWTLTDAACQFAGAIDVPIYPTLAPPQVSYILKDSGARLLFVSSTEKADQLREVIRNIPSVERVIVFDGSEAPGDMTLAQLESQGEELLQEDPSLIDRISQAIAPEDLATIIYTSGTTGEPKGVMLTQSNLVSNVIDCAGHLTFGEADRVLSVLPLSHIFERTAMYMYLHQGMAVYYAESLDTIGPNLREVEPTILVGVPRIFEKILARVKERSAEKGKFNVALLAWAISVGRDHARLAVKHQPIPSYLEVQHKIADRLIFSKLREAMGGRIRLLISGGAALPEELGYIYLGAGLPIVQGYGLTETSPVITAGQLDDNRIGTVGKPIRNVEVRIAADGEIECRGPNVMRGYYNKPAETAAVLSADGWFKTGDIGTFDEDGYLKITDRKKELFKTSGGKYIAPQVVEQLIKGSRFVNQVVLIGNERKFPAALIVPEWELIASYAELKGIDYKNRSELCTNPRIINLFQRQIANLTADLAQFEKVKRIALLENELTIEGGELTPTMKVKRRVIDEKYRDVIDRIYADAEASGRS